MMLELNPLNILGQRQTSVMPRHFSKVNLETTSVVDNDSLIAWINNKLNGRFCITNQPSVNTKGQLRLSTFVGFEDQKELTFFMLACPYFRRKK